MMYSEYACLRVQRHGISLVIYMLYYQALPCLDFSPHKATMLSFSISEHTLQYFLHRLLHTCTLQALLALVATQVAEFLSYNGCRHNGAMLCGNVSCYHPVAKRE